MYEEFVCDKPSSTFLWRTTDGRNHLEWPTRRQSWAVLRNEANRTGDTPEVIREHLDLLWFLMLVYPHQCTPTIMRALDAIATMPAAAASVGGAELA